MPPEAPRVSTGVWRYVLLFIAGALLGAIAAVPGTFLFLRTDLGNQLLRTYVVPPPQWPNVDLSNTAPSSTVYAPVQPAPQQANGTSTVVVVNVPPADAGQQYSVAINQLVRSFQDIGTTYEQLVPVLTTLNRKSLAGDYTNFFNVVVQAKSLLAQDELNLAQFGQHLTELAAANNTTPDAVTKSLTQDLLAKGAAEQSAFGDYFTALDQLLSGPPPTASQLSDVYAKAAVAESATTAFGAATQALFSHFAGKAPAGQ